MRAWAVMWRQVKNGVEQQTLLGNHLLLFATRAKARQYIAREYGYIRHRQDLRRAPHGWRMPQPARVRIVVDADSSMDEERLRKWCQREYMQIRAARSRLRNEKIAAEAEGMMRALATMLALLEDATPDSTDRMPPLGAQLKEDK